ncbi:MAG: lysozyme [Methylococcales bacterium]
MQMSINGRKLLEQWEGVRLIVYKDSANLPTIAVGHLLTSSERSSGKININGEIVEYTNGLTTEQADALLAQDLKPAETTVSNGVKVKLNQNQFDALVSFTFNVGGGAFNGSTLLKVLNQGEYDQVPSQLISCDKSAGQVVPGLQNRRNYEIKLWNT